MVIDLFLYLFLTSIKLTYEQFETDSLLEDPMDVNLDSVAYVAYMANVAGGSSNDGRSWLKSEASYDQNYIIQIDDLDDKEVMIEAVAIENGPTDDVTAAENSASSSANQNGIDGSTVFTQNTSAAGNSNNGYDFFSISHQYIFCKLTFF